MLYQTVSGLKISLVFIYLKSKTRKMRCLSVPTVRFVFNEKRMDEFQHKRATWADQAVSYDNSVRMCCLSSFAWSPQTNHEEGHRRGNPPKKKYRHEAWKTVCFDLVELFRALSGDPPMTQVTLERQHLQIYRMTDNTPDKQKGVCGERNK